MAEQSRELEVRLHGERIGRLYPAQGEIEFEYEPGYVGRADAIALSARLPLVAGRAKHREALRWFEGLLPEGERRRWIAEQAGAASMSTYSMLEAIGAECAGAVEVRGPRARAAPGKAPAHRAEIGEYVSGIERRPMGSPERLLTLSLAGAQAKFVLCREPDGGWSWPIGGYPSTHILKPSQARFPELVENEHACMELARRAGLQAAKTWIERFGEHDVLVVERFDREPGGGRIHQEDFCQVLGRRAKYQHDHGGPSLQDCFGVEGPEPGALWDQIMFAWLIGDEDKHGKNFSVQYPREGGVRLAPIYDAVCTLAYPELSREMAMRIGTARTVNEVDERALRSQARRAGLEEDGAIARTHALAERMRDALQVMREEGVDVKMLERAGVEERMEIARRVAGRGGGETDGG